MTLSLFLPVLSVFLLRCKQDLKDVPRGTETFPVVVTATSGKRTGSLSVDARARYVAPRGSDVVLDVQRWREPRLLSYPDVS